MEAWRDVWRRGIAPLLSTEGLEALRLALLDDDLCLIQQSTVQPPPLLSLASWPAQAACAMAYPCWKSEGLVTVQEVEDRFARLCGACDRELGEPGIVRHFFAWFDHCPRDEMRRELLAEVTRTLAERTPHEPPAAPADVGPAGPDDRAAEAGA